MGSHGICCGLRAMGMNKDLMMRGRFMHCGIIGVVYLAIPSPVSRRQT